VFFSLRGTGFPIRFSSIWGGWKGRDLIPCRFGAGETCWLARYGMGELHNVVAGWIDGWAVMIAHLIDWVLPS
jgi:hypothetical protein